MSACSSASRRRGDASNIDGAITGPISEWRLVPHDNNIAQRNVHPVFPQLVKVDWKKLPFWIRNHGRLPVRVGPHGEGAELASADWDGSSPFRRSRKIGPSSG